MSLKTFFCGMKTDTPEDVKKELIPGEKVLHSVKQARTEQLITPDTIVVTTERVMIRRPAWFGLTAKNRDFRYDDMGNVTVHMGIINATVSVKMRLLSHDLILKAIPKDVAPLISRTIQKGIDGRFKGFGEEHRPSAAATHTESSGDLFQILKYRYAKGDITKEEYDRMKRDLS